MTAPPGFERDVAPVLDLAGFLVGADSLGAATGSMLGASRPRSGAGGGIDAVAATWTIGRRGRRALKQFAEAAGRGVLSLAREANLARPRERGLKPERGAGSAGAAPQAPP